MPDAPRKPNLPSRHWKDVKEYKDFALEGWREYVKDNLNSPEHREKRFGAFGFLEDKIESNVNSLNELIEKQIREQRGDLTKGQLERKIQESRINYEDYYNILRNESSREEDKLYEEDQKQRKAKAEAERTRAAEAKVRAAEEARRTEALESNREDAHELERQRVFQKTGKDIGPYRKTYGGLPQIEGVGRFDRFMGHPLTQIIGTLIEQEVAARDKGEVGPIGALYKVVPALAVPEQVVRNVAGKVADTKPARETTQAVKAIKTGVEKDFSEFADEAGRTGRQLAVDVEKKGKELVEEGKRLGLNALNKVFGSGRLFF